MTYAEFCQLARTPLTLDELSSTDETPATPEELRWRLGWQVLRAIRHKRAGVPTRQDLHLIEEKTEIVVTKENYHQVRIKELEMDQRNADKYFPLSSF